MSRSRSEPSSETLCLQRCWGQGTVTQPRWQHPLPSHHPARCHHAIPTWASRPEPGLLPPRAGHRGQVAPGVQGRGRLRPTAPPPLLLLLAPGPVWATRRGSEMRRPAARSELPPTGCGTHGATAPRGHHPRVSPAGGRGGLSGEETARSHLFLADKPLCPSSVCQPPASPGPSAGQPVPPAAAGSCVPRARARHARLPATNTALSSALSPHHPGPIPSSVSPFPHLLSLHLSTVPLSQP